jgi:zinc protease
MNPTQTFARRTAVAVVALAAWLVCGLPVAAHTAQGDAPAIETVELPSGSSPIVAFRLMFRAGSLYDPPGKEGLAALTASMISSGGTTERSYGELVDALYPMAAFIGSSVDREVAVVSGQAHRDTLGDYTALLVEALTRPAFTESDFERNKDQLSAYLTNTLRGSNDELLGLEALQQQIFDGHPYESAPAGTVQGLASITIDDVRAFYRQHYTPDNLLLGLAGGYPADFPASFSRRLGALPQGDGNTAKAELTALAPVEGRHYTLVEKDAAATGIHLGYALPITRADDDYFPLMVANSFLGEHRTFNGRLMQQLRGERGLNYGDYSYIEYYANGPFVQTPTPNVPRRQQYFSIWIRPVVPNTALFAIRNALFEVERLREQGLTQEEFELTRDYLANYSKLWVQTLSERLGFMMDSEFYDAPYFIDELDRRLRTMTAEDVNEAIREYLQTDDFQAVFVTANARALASQLFADDASPIEYASEKEADILETDEKIQVIPLAPDSVEIVPVARMFER